MDEEHVVKCPGCGKGNLSRETHPGETEVHEKGCTFITGSVAATDPPFPEKKEPVLFRMAVGLIFSFLVFCCGAVYGETAAHQKDDEVIKTLEKLNTTCNEQSHTFVTAWVEQLKQTTDCLHVLGKKAVEQSDKLVKEAEALGMPHQAITQ
jgi:hypothetical protein